MRKKLIYIVVAIVLFIIPSKINVKAVNLCENRTIADYRELFKNVKLYSDYRMVDGRAVFDVTITNIPNNVFIEDAVTGKMYSYANFTTENELIIKDYKENQKLTYRFYMEESGCYGQVLGTRIITLPNYNETSTDPLCEGIEEFSLCQKWGAISGTYSEFKKRANEYREKKGLTSETNKPQQTSETFKNRIIAFIGSYYIYLVAAVAIIVLLLIALKTWATEKTEFDFKV